MNPACPNCRGEGWVCEAHPDKPWLDGKGCCGEPAVPCECNPKAEMPPGFKPHRIAQFARLDALTAIPEDDRSEDEWDEFEKLAHLLADPEYQAHVRALVEGADQPKRH